MNFLDAMILNVADEHQSSKFITWYTKHFMDRTYLSIQTPKEFLEDW